MKMSSPVWEAWIEITAVHITLMTGRRRLPYGRRGLKLVLLL